jgi:hypothetical protein
MAKVCTQGTWGSPTPTLPNCATSGQATAPPRRHARTIVNRRARDLRLWSTYGLKAEVLGPLPNGITLGGGAGGENLSGHPSPVHKKVRAVDEGCFVARQESDRGGNLLWLCPSSQGLLSFPDPLHLGERLSRGF